MKISYEKHGVEGIENCLAYLAAFDDDDIESDEFEIIGEDEEGREGSADISIINLAEEACRALAAQRKRIAQLEQERDAYRTAEEHQIALRQKIERERDQAAANANRLRAALHYCNEYLYGSHLNTIGHGSKAHMEIADALGETPANSLARRDALKQAEVLELAEKAMTNEQDAATMRLNAAELRKRAQELAQ
ncbi:MAG TPA: hypothetical protein DD685_04265 [Halomonas sp.]|nr:hypothetical protein [Halomonas sp.]|tara:strand:+ start:1228 stop:1806 length:579 start_codon:yes stop_codon:yes gene_type:complete